MTTDNNNKILSGSSLTQYLKKGPQNIIELSSYLDTLKNCWKNPQLTSIHQSNTTILDIYLANLLQSCTKGDIENWSLAALDNINWCLQPEFWDTLTYLFNWQNFKFNSEDVIEVNLGPNGELDLEKFKLMLNKHHLLLPILGGIKFISYKLNSDVGNWKNLKILAENLDYTLKAYFEWMDFNNMSLPKTAPFYNISKQPHVDLVKLLISTLSIGLENATSLDESDLNTLISLGESGIKLLTKMVKWEENYKLIFIQIIENMLDPIIELFYYLNNSDSIPAQQFLERFKSYIHTVFFPNDQLNGYRHSIEAENDTNELSYHSKLFDKLESSISLNSENKVLKYGSIQSLPIWLELFCKDPSTEKDHIKVLKAPLAFKLLKMTYPYLKIEELFSEYKVASEMPKKRVKKSTGESMNIINDQLECIKQSIQSSSQIIQLCKDQNLFSNTLGVAQLVDRDALIAEFIQLITNIQSASSSTTAMYILPGSNQLSECLSSCLTCYSKLISLNPIQFEDKLKELWDLALISKFEGSLELALSLINNYSRVRKLDNCISALVKSLIDTKPLDITNTVIVYNTKFIDNLYNILNESTNIHQLDSILEPISAELISRLKGENLHIKGSPHQFYLVSQLTHIWSIIVISYDKLEVKKHLSGHFNRFIDEIFISAFKWKNSQLKEENHCKKKLKKIFNLFDSDKTDVNFINALQLLSITLSTNPESLSEYVTIQHFYNLVKQMGSKVSLSNKLGNLLVLKSLIQSGDLILSSNFKGDVLVDIFKFILNQLETNSKFNQSTGEVILLDNLDSNYNEAIWNQLTSRVGWSTIYSGLTIPSGRDDVGDIIDSLAKSILNRQLLCSFEDTDFTLYQLEGDRLAHYWLQHWLKVAQEGLFYYKENFTLEISKPKSFYEHEKLNWLNLDNLDLSKVKELSTEISKVKLNAKLVKEQIKFLSLMFNNLRKVPPNLINESTRVKSINLIHVVLIFININCTPNADEELIGFVNVLVSTLLQIQPFLTKSQANRLLKFNGFANLMDCILPIISKIDKFSNWYELRNRLASIFTLTMSSVIQSNQNDFTQIDETLLSLCQPQQSSNGENVWIDIYRIDLMNNIFNSLNASYSGLFQSDLDKMQSKLISNYYSNRLEGDKSTLFNKDTEAHLASISKILTDHKSIFESNEDELPVDQLSILLRDILKEVEFLKRIIYSQYSVKNFELINNLRKLRESAELNLLITKLTLTLTNRNNSNVTNQLLFQSLLNLIQLKLVLFSNTNPTKLIPTDQLMLVIDWIQKIYNFASPRTLNTKLISKVSLIGNNIGKLMNQAQMEVIVASILEKIGYHLELNELLSTLRLLSDWLLEDTNNKRNFKVKAINSTINHLISSILTCMDSENRQSLILPSLEFIYNSLGVAKYQLDQSLISSILQFLHQLLKHECQLNELHLITKVVIRMIKFHFKLIQLTSLQLILVELIFNWVVLFNLNNWTRVDLIVSPILLSLPSKYYTEELTKSFDLIICNLLAELIQHRLEFSQVFTGRNTTSTPEFVFEESYINKNLTSEFEGWFHIFLILETCSNQLNQSAKRDEDFSLKKVLGWLSPHGQNLLKMVRKLYLEGVKFKGKV